MDNMVRPSKSMALLLESHSFEELQDFAVRETNQRLYPLGFKHIRVQSGPSMVL